jgi:hypothetical protein
MKKITGPKLDFHLWTKLDTKFVRVLSIGGLPQPAANNCMQSGKWNRLHAAALHQQTTPGQSQLTTVFKLPKRLLTPDLSRK